VVGHDRQGRFQELTLSVDVFTLCALYDGMENRISEIYQRAISVQVRNIDIRDLTFQLG
jgi:hypothetical protein